MEDLNALARAWLEQETNPAFAAAIESALARGDQDELRRGFAEPLAFGTAGLRGPVGFGPARMNEVVVARASFGLARTLLGRGLEARPVVIGFDGRAESAVYARLAVGVLAGAGLAVDFLERPSATPIIVRAGRARRAGAIVAVTPSHNPRGDAGFKVYDEWGIQIVAPWDREIAEAMALCPAPSGLPRAEARAAIADEAHFEYRSILRSLLPARTGRPARAAYTPLHGVGAEGARLIVELSETALEFVPEQTTVDGTFPTVPFPNPEEPGTLDLLAATMRRSGATLGLANDPDADRLAVILRGSAEEEPRRLTGDQLGLLLASCALERATLAAPLVVSSIVSSPALAEFARARGARHEYTLTGFKWLCRPALDDAGFVFAYEEALGYCWAPDGHPYVLDKDGLGAMALLLDAVRRRGVGESEGAFVRRRLDRLALEAGAWTSASRSVRLGPGGSSLAELSRAMAALRASPPRSLGGRTVTRVLDFEHGSPLEGRYLGQQNLLLLELAGGGRLCVRPSGTEPKLKLYLHLRSEVSSEDDVRGREALLEEEARELLDRVVELFTRGG